MRPVDLPEDPAAWEVSPLPDAPLPTWRLTRPGIALDIRQSPAGLLLTLRWEAPALSATDAGLALLPHEGRLADATVRYDPRDGDGPPLRAGLRLASEAAGARARHLHALLSAAANLWAAHTAQPTILEIAPDGAWTVQITSLQGPQGLRAQGASPASFHEILRAWAGPMRRRPPHRPHLLACILGHLPDTAHRRLQQHETVRQGIAALETSLPEGFLPPP